MNKHKYRLIEERLERIKYFGSLQLQELERFYNGDSIIRKYDGAGKFVCHVHCLWHEDALAKWRLCLEVTGPVHEDLGAAVNTHPNRHPMPAGACETVESAEPRITIVGLKCLDQCDFFFPDTFEFGRSPTPESLWTVTNRKLQAFIDGIPSRGDQRANQVVQSDDQMLKTLTNERSKIIERFSDWIVELMGVGAKPFDENLSRLAIPNAVYPFFEVRQAFSTLADPPIGLFDGHIFGDTPNSNIA